MNGPRQRERVEDGVRAAERRQPEPGRLLVEEVEVEGHLVSDQDRLAGEGEERGQHLVERGGRADVADRPYWPAFVSRAVRLGAVFNDVQPMAIR